MRGVDRARKSLLFGDRTYRRHRETDAFDPEQTSRINLLDHLIGAGNLLPVIEHEHVGLAVTRLIGTVHRYALSCARNPCFCMAR